MPHEHRVIDETALHSSSQRLFTPTSHAYTHLAQLVVKFSQNRGGHLSDLQKKALERYQTKPIYNLDNEESHKTCSILQAYFDLFDMLFFFGAIKGCCTVVMKDPPDGTNYDGKTTAHMKNPLQLVMPSQAYVLHTKIIVYRSLSKPRRRRLMEYIETLLHEMMHAFFFIWGCCHLDCIYKYETCGATGHGLDWLDMAYAVERAVQDKYLLDLELKMDLRDSVALELLKTNKKTSDIDLQRWEIKERDVKLAMKRIPSLKGYWVWKNLSLPWRRS